jgi:hypothetical protein
VGASRPNGFLRQTNEYGQADSDHASLRTGLDNAEQHDRYLRIRSWGFESLRAVNGIRKLIHFWHLKTDPPPAGFSLRPAGGGRGRGLGL